MTLGQRTNLDGETISQEWPFTFTLQSPHVWDAFVILSLLEDCNRQSTTLDVPHDGSQRDRFSSAIHRRNIRIQHYGLPEVPHRCDRCTRYYDRRTSGMGIGKEASYLSQSLTLILWNRQGVLCCHRRHNSGPPLLLCS